MESAKNTSSRTWLFLGCPAIYGWASVLAIIVGLCFTAHQVSLSAAAVKGNMMYNMEKDYRPLLDSTQDPQFIDCYANATSSIFPAICPSLVAQGIFFKLMNFLQLLYSLQNIGAVEENYVTSQIKRSCIYAKSPEGTYTLDKFRKDGLIDNGFAINLKRICGG
jgi:uncharacterized membrane protein SpoIIM required for sporulation